MASRFRMAKARVARAERLILDVATALVELNGAVSLERSDTPLSDDSVCSEWRLQLGEPVPDSLLLDISDALHELRSALDNTMWRLLKDSGANSRMLGASYFPICAKDEDFSRRASDARSKAPGPLDLLDRLEPTQVEIITGVQPFMQRNPADEPLRHLQLLSNRDKHRMPPVAATAAVGSAVGMLLPDGWHSVTVRDDEGVSRSPARWSPGPVQPGEVIAALDRPTETPEMQVHLILDWVIDTRGSPLSGRGWRDTLLAILTRIDEGVLDPLIDSDLS